MLLKEVKYSPLSSERNDEIGMDFVMYLSVRVCGKKNRFFLFFCFFFSRSERWKNTLWRIFMFILKHFTPRKLDCDINLKFVLSFERAKGSILGLRQGYRVD